MPMVANYAVEDGLSESVIRRCFEHTKIESGAVLGREGYGYLKRIAPALNLASRGVPYVMLTDLDDGACAPELVRSWMGSAPIHPNFLLRVAVREVEAWILADQKGFARYLGIAEAVLPRDCEELDDPKRELLLAARRSRFRRIREDIVAESRRGFVQGPDYNGALSGFVVRYWSITRAASKCESLRKALRRLQELRDRSA